MVVPPPAVPMVGAPESTTLPPVAVPAATKAPASSRMKAPAPPVVVTLPATVRSPV